jgi:CDGSH-type Zn-finger protein
MCTRAASKAGTMSGADRPGGPVSAADDGRPKARARRVPACPQNGPYEEIVEEGRSYRWCSCGLSRAQPWCDDSHAGTGMEPIEFTAPISATFFMCGCKRTENPPYCFGTCRGHKSARRNAAG